MMNAKFGKIRKHALLGLLALALLAPPLHGGTYDAVADFSITDNPNGVWSYGLLTEAEFTLYTNNTRCSDGSHPPGWECWANEQGEPNTSSVSHNATDHDLSFLSITLPPDLLSLDSQSLTAVVRFAAPADGTYAVNGRFQTTDRSPRAKRVQILLNGAELLLDTVLAEGMQAFDFPQDLSEGDTLDFIVRYDGDWTFLSTGLAVTISTLER